jgi:4-diphosphocytidyl-2-C-methyl-D-erythritol kinase
LPETLLDTPVAVLKPPIAIPTPAIFASPLLKRDSAHAIVDVFLAAPKRFGHNDLQPPAMAQSVEVAQALEIMQDRFGNSRMTGSGSAVFSWVEPEAQTANSLFSPTDLGLSDRTWAGRLCRLLPGG